MKIFWILEEEMERDHIIFEHNEEIKKIKRKKKTENDEREK